MAEDFPDVWTMAGWHGPPPEVRDALWAAWPENSFSRKLRWHEAVLSQHPWEDEEKGLVVEVSGRSAVVQRSHELGAAGAH